MYKPVGPFTFALVYMILLQSASTVEISCVQTHFVLGVHYKAAVDMIFNVNRLTHCRGRKGREDLSLDYCNNNTLVCDFTT